MNSQIYFVEKKSKMNRSLLLASNWSRVSQDVLSLSGVNGT